MGRRNEILEFGFGVALLFWLLQAFAQEGGREPAGPQMVEYCYWINRFFRGHSLFGFLLGIECAIRWTEARQRTRHWFSVVQSENVALILVATLGTVLTGIDVPYALAAGCFVATLFVSNDERKMKLWTVVSVVFVLGLLGISGWVSYRFFTSVVAGDSPFASLFYERWRNPHRDGPYLLGALPFTLDVLKGALLAGLAMAAAPFMGYWLERKGLLQRGIRTRKRSLLLMSASLFAAVLLSSLSLNSTYGISDFFWSISAYAYGLTVIGAMKAWGTSWMDFPWLTPIRTIGRSALSLAVILGIVVYFISAPFGLDRQAQLSIPEQLGLTFALFALSWPLAHRWKVGPLERFIAWAGSLLVPRPEPVHG